MGEMGKAMMGTGEGEGPNRALEAAEKAIANPLLDGVSMQGAKGVIISIIGGEDMKLLEVDEAANHIRELVDPNANIIWGSAFNPDLDGKIRVSVVATGIEQTAQQAETASRPFSLGASRGPARPAMAAPVVEPEPEPEPVHQPLFGREPEPEPEPEPVHQPLFNRQPEPEEDELEASYGDEGWSGERDGDAAEPLELALSEEVEPEQARAPEAGDAVSDELLLDASRLHEEDAPVGGLALPGRRRGLVAGDGDDGEYGGGAPVDAGTEQAAGDDGPTMSKPAPKVASGATLFERMANLSRGGRSKSDDEDDEDDGGGSISIPRFLGRQNNQ
jgi:cell division protein FtsZ